MESVCNICADNLFDSTHKQDLSALLCGHTFHRDCLDEWWNVRKECPNCRMVWTFKIDKLYFDISGEVNHNLQDEMADLQSILQLQENELEQMKEALETESALKEVLELDQRRLEKSLQEREKDIEELRWENQVFLNHVGSSECRLRLLKEKLQRAHLEVQLTDLRQEVVKIKEVNENVRHEVVQLNQQATEDLKKIQIVVERMTTLTERLNCQIRAGEAEIATLRKNLRNVIEQNETNKRNSPYQLFFPDEDLLDKADRLTTEV